MGGDFLTLGCQEAGRRPGPGAHRQKGWGVAGPHTTGNDSTPPPAPPQRRNLQGPHTYPPALVKRAHVGEPRSRAEPGRHDHSWAVGGENLEAISVDRINREQLVTKNL